MVLALKYCKFLNNKALVLKNKYLFQWSPIVPHFRLSRKGNIKSSSSVCLPYVHHKNFNLAHNFKLPSWTLSKFGGRVYPKEIYNSLLFPARSHENCSHGNHFLKFSDLGILSCGLDHLHLIWWKYDPKRYLCRQQFWAWSNKICCHANHFCFSI